MEGLEKEIRELKKRLAELEDKVQLIDINKIVQKFKELRYFL